MKLGKQDDQENSQFEFDTGEKPKRNLSKKWLGCAIGAVAGALLAGFICHGLFQSQVVNETEAQLDNLVQQKADLTARAVQTYFDSVVEKANFFSSQSLLKSALLSQDEAMLSDTKRTITRQLKNVEAVHIFARGEAQLDAKRFPPIRFSELALIRGVERGEPSRVEAVKVDDRWLLHIVVPIQAVEAEEVEGVVWISTSIEGVKPVLLSGNEGLGEVFLYQNFSKLSRPLVTKVGGATLPNTAVSGFEDSQWEVQFVASDGLSALTHINTSFVYSIMLAIVAALAGALAALGYFVGNRSDVASSRLSMQDTIRTGAGASISTDGLTDPMYQAQNAFEVEIADEDESLLGLDDDEQSSELADEGLSLDDDVFDMDGGETAEGGFPDEVFRAYDIRGVAEEQIDKEFALALGKALGSELLEQRENTLVVARDARTHSPQLTEWLVRGILSTGCNVLNIGTVPTPLMYFVVETMDEVSSGVMVTASHNAAKYNGFKMVINGVSRSGEDIKGLRRRMNAKRFIDGHGQEHHHDIVPTYIETIFSDVALAGEVSLVIDAGNGVAGKVAPKLFEELGCRVTPLYCDLDGTFPNHDPDPSVEANLQDLIAKVRDDDADLGIALDGDGDRLTVVSKTGKIYWADRLLMLFATDIISRTPGADVVFDVKSTRHLNTCIANAGGRPVMWKTGHSYMKQKMIETGAVVGAEYSGHIFIKDRWFGFDDGMYAAARLLEILSLQGEDIDETFAPYPESLSTPEIRVPIDEAKKFEIIESLKENGDFGEGRLTLLDGLRADYSYGWGLVRASNTGAELTLRFEADDEASLHKLKSIFVKELRLVDSTIQVDWNQ